MTSRKAIHMPEFLRYCFSENDTEHGCLNLQSGLWAASLLRMSKSLTVPFTVVKQARRLTILV